MHRRTIYLDRDLEVRLKLEAMRRKKPVAAVIRDALRSYFNDRHEKLPPGVGAFRSNRKKTAERAEKVLRDSRFGED